MNSRCSGGFDVVGRQILRLKFQGGHDARALLGVEIEPLLAGGFGGIYHAGQGHIGMLGITRGFLQQAVDELGSEAFVAPDRQAATWRVERFGTVGFQVNRRRGAAAPHLHAPIVDDAIIVEDSDGDECFADSEFLIAVLARAVD